LLGKIIMAFLEAVQQCSGGRKISFSYPRLESELIQCINMKNEGKKNEWMREECVCFISRDVNKLLDIFAKNNQTTIPEGGRERVFQRAGFYCGFSLDVRGAQAYTHHMILNSPYFQKKMDTLLASADMDIRNQCIHTALSSLADIIDIERNPGIPERAE
ncbi:hypothetical protein ABH230_004597, partial [Escherichia coli]